MSHSDFPIHIKESSSSVGFFQWIKHNTAFFISQLAAIVSLVLYIGTFSYYVVGHDPNSHKSGYEEYLLKTQHVVFLLNICFTIIFVIASLYFLDKNEEGKNHLILFNELIFKIVLTPNDKILLTAQKHLKKFKKVFIGFWLYALLFYLFTLLFPQQDFITIKNPEASFLNITDSGSFIKDFRYWFLMIGNIMIVIVYRGFCIMILSNQVKYNGEKKIPFLLRFILSVHAPIALYLFLALIPLIPLIHFFGLKGVKITDWFQLMFLISGIIKMIILSLLFSRFDSKLMGLPSWLVSFLYIYAAIQPLDIALVGDDIISISMATTDYVVAFILKTYFFLILTYAMQTGRVLNFFCTNGEMNKRLTKSRTKQLSE